MARPLIRLLFIALTRGKLLMNEYVVVRNRRKENTKEYLSPIVLKPQGCQPCAAKYFFSFAIARFMDLATAWWLVPSLYRKRVVLGKSVALGGLRLI